ncbi:GGDEF domain-containing protein [Streptomyces sp. NP160]|uniref:GGDEF domain-containing protein n=1 Tax=Streptomyces sp. NP160 TaxID=2586637 RepID=UPI001118C5A3|nr:GGDEF domain-containing protein [Streptomyces sp. NP160]TNM70477.1 GGDEF domain-containing protein [Streptomyces sp. NP160]
MGVTTRLDRSAAFDWRTGLLAVLFGCGVVEVGIGVQLSRTGVLAVETSTMLVVSGVWVGLFAWCLLRRRLTEGEALVQLCAMSTLLVLESLLVPDPTWQWVCATVLVVVPVAGVVFLRPWLLGLLAVGVAAGQAVVVLARHQDPLLATYALSAVLLCSLVPVVVVFVLAAAVRSAQARAELLARTDALTGLLNRHGMGEAADGAVRAAVQRQGVLGVLVADVDRFKAVNDSWGHAVGDQVLALTARTLRAVLRDGDLVVRLGGEEVAVVGTWNDDDALTRAAERLRAAVEAQHEPGVPAVTVSIGTASCRPGRSRVGDGGPTAAELLARLVDEADQGLYAAEHAGRNCVRTSPCSAPPEQTAAPGARIGA